MRRERPSFLRLSIKTYLYILPREFSQLEGEVLFLWVRTFGELSATRRLWSTKPEFGLSLFSKNKVRPTFGVRSQLPEILSQKCTGLPLQRPTRARYARVRRFSFFAFTSSPQGRKNLCINDLQVKASPLFPSPVKAKKGTILHPQNSLYQ